MKIIGVIGWKNSGKTYYVQEIIKILRKKGYSVASIKHAHHEFDVDKPKTDSFLHRKAGSQQVIISSSKRWVKITELENSTEKNLTELIQQLSTTDIVIVEGFKNDNHPKIEIIKEKSKNYLFNQISNVVALISDIEVDSNIRKFKKNEIDLIVNFILNDL
tara:strand:- start:692 stop:1174 length:483 start_codon:yes stop_codon:yes gene_type:complete